MYFVVIAAAAVSSVHCLPDICAVKKKEEKKKKEYASCFESIRLGGINGWEKIRG